MRDAIEARGIGYDLDVLMTPIPAKRVFLGTIELYIEKGSKQVTIQDVKERLSVLDNLMGRLGEVYLEILSHMLVKLGFNAATVV